MEHSPVQGLRFIECFPVVDADISRVIKQIKAGNP